MAVELDTTGNGAIDIEKGGTNATSAVQALSNLGGQPYDADLDILSSGSFSQKRALIEAFAKPVFGVVALRTTMADFDGDCRYLVCHTAYGDGGHGTFCWDAASTKADDNGVTIAVTGVATGRWIRQLNGFVTPEMFGLDGTNDNFAVQAAIDTGLNVYGTGPDTVYYFSSGVTIPAFDNNPQHQKQQIIDLRGATVHSGSLIPYAFLMTSAPWPGMNDQKVIRNIRFSGYITDCILLTGNHHFRHDIGFLSTVGGPLTGDFESVVHIQNTLLGSGANPGGVFYIHDIKGISSTTDYVVHLSSDSVVVVDDLYIERCHWGAAILLYMEKTTLAHSRVIDSYGQNHGVYMELDGSSAFNCTFDNLYLEVDASDIYGFYGIAINSIFNRIRIQVDDYTVHTGVQCVHLDYDGVTFSNNNQINLPSLHSLSGGVPYLSAVCPAVYIKRGRRNKITGLDPDYLTNSIQYDLGTYSSYTGTIVTDGPKIANKSTNYAITTNNDNGFTFTNDGATAAVQISLPYAYKGLKYGFYRTSATYNLTPVNSFGHTIGGVGSSLPITVQYGYVELECVKDGQWSVVSKNF